MNTFGLCEKVNLTVIPSTKFKTNYLSVNFVMNLSDKNATNAALLSRILTKGCEKYKNISLVEKHLEYLYDMTLSISTVKRGENLILTYAADFLKDEYISGESLLDSAVDMFENVTFEPLVKNGAFDKEIFEIAKSELENAINSLLNNKTALAKQKCTQIMCQNEPYAVSELGSIETLNTITPVSLYEFYLDFIKTAPVEIYFTGSANESGICKSFERVFSKFERNPKEIDKTKIEIFDKINVKEKSEKMHINQGKLSMGFRTGAGISKNNAAATLVFCDIFGSSPTSKLFMNVREKMSLCYYCSSSCDIYKGVMFVNSGIDAKNKEKTQKAVLCELENMKNGKITDEEMHFAKLSLKNDLRGLSDNPYAYMFWHLSRSINGSDITCDEFAKEIDNVTIEDVVNVASGVKLDTVFFLDAILEKEGE